MLLWTQLERSKEIENDNTVVIKDLGVDAELRPEKNSESNAQTVGRKGNLQKMFLTFSNGDWRGDRGEKHLGIGGCINSRFVGQR